ncbi:MAG: hypothetical protein FJ100_06370 [Deltaproteobacteria bacterium]|nr:hypothetical protein [Deltaproteobacteria bacterium]
MTIDPKDFRTLLARVALVTFALRAALMFTLDLSPLEAAPALGAMRDGAPADLWGRAVHAWTVQSGGSAGLMRLPSLFAEVALPLLAVGFARVAGWGSLSGLFVGLACGLGPWAMQAGHRLGAASWVALAVLLALLWLRGGVRDGDPRRVWASASVVAVGGCLWAPMLLAVPAGIYVAWRAVADDRLRAQAAIGWGVAAAGAVGVRVAFGGFILPEPDAAAAAWIDADLWGHTGWPAAGGWALAQALALVSPIGPAGELSAQLDLMPTPSWSAALGLALLAGAAWGWARGLVQPDPPIAVARTPAAANDGTQDDDDPDAATGAGARDGWRSLGVLLPAVPRELGDRDGMPFVLLALASAVFALQAALRGRADGLGEALAVGRLGAAVLVGVGLAALATTRAAASDPGHPRVRRRAYQVLGLAAVALFAAGAWHLLAQVNHPERAGPRKVARFARDAASDVSVVGDGKAALLGVGARALPVAALIDPSRSWPLLGVAKAEAGDAATQLVALLYGQPRAVVLFGDAGALSGDDTLPRASRAVAEALAHTLALAGFEQVPDSHRQLGPTAVVVYSRQRPTDPRTIRPQLAPGVPP